MIGTSTLSEGVENRKKFVMIQCIQVLDIMELRDVEEWYLGVQHRVLEVQRITGRDILIRESLSTTKEMREAYVDIDIEEVRFSECCFNGPGLGSLI